VPSASAVLTGLYDHQGVLRFAGRDVDDCLAYAELFALPPGSFSITSLELLDRTEDVLQPPVASLPDGATDPITRPEAIAA
jgi:hypothetical protein